MKLRLAKTTNTDPISCPARALGVRFNPFHDVIRQTLRCVGCRGVFQSVTRERDVRMGLEKLQPTPTAVPLASSVTSQLTTLSPCTRTPQRPASNPPSAVARRARGPVRSAAHVVHDFDVVHVAGEAQGEPRQEGLVSGHRQAGVERHAAAGAQRKVAGVPARTQTPGELFSTRSRRRAIRRACSLPRQDQRGVQSQVR